MNENQAEWLRKGELTHRRFPRIQLLFMGRLLALNGPQRIQSFISLISRLSHVRQRTREFSLRPFLRFRKLPGKHSQPRSREKASPITATVVACVRDAIASEIIEAGVVVGGMRERVLMDHHVRGGTRSSLSPAWWLDQCSPLLGQTQRHALKHSNSDSQWYRRTTAEVGG
jgi:hypothetical protein